MKAATPRTFAIAAVAAIAIQSAGAQSTVDRAKVLRAAADALGMPRFADIGNGATRLPPIDVVNTMEFHGSGTSYSADRALNTEYRVALGYNPAAMRVEMTRTGSGGGAPQHSIQTVRENHAWDESETGDGLVTGNGAETPALAARTDRDLAP